MTIAQIHDLLLEEYVALDHYVDECWDMTGREPAIEDIATLKIMRGMLESCSPEQFELRKVEIVAMAAADAAAAAEQDSDEDPF